MPTLVKFSLLPMILSAPLFAGCFQSEPKMLEVVNETPSAIDVQFGTTGFGLVAAGEVSPYLEFDDGTLALRFDGQIVASEQLASDNVGGLWTLTIQYVDLPRGQGQRIFGFNAE